MQEKATVAPVLEMTLVAVASRASKNAEENSTIECMIGDAKKLIEKTDSMAEKTHLNLIETTRDIF